MRYAIISDIHANLEALEAVLRRIDDLHVDQLVCLGDVVGYNANPDECATVIREAGIPTICGNHDAVACGIEEPWGFNPVALHAALWTREHLSEINLAWLKQLPDSIKFEHFLAAHGSPTDRDCYLFTWEDVLPHLNFLEEQDYRLCFFGHTHSPGIFSTDGLYTVDSDSKFALGEGKTFFINPGSVGQPRDGDPRAAFGLYDSEKNEYEQIRAEYDIRKAADRVVESGLPPFLGERLFLGR
ncbi:MAG: metallophosphoesterase family protein [Candidatus Hydrogenedentes bacterium]|nr:metallophosphoesterase family protein [Candidatus Hydrogenedentota bacterium]